MVRPTSGVAAQISDLGLSAHGQTQTSFQMALGADAMDADFKSVEVHQNTRLVYYQEVYRYLHLFHYADYIYQHRV